MCEQIGRAMHVVTGVRWVCGLVKLAVLRASDFVQHNDSMYRQEFEGVGVMVGDQKT